MMGYITRTRAIKQRWRLGPSSLICNIFRVRVILSIKIHTWVIIISILQTKKSILRVSIKNFEILD